MKIGNKVIVIGDWWKGEAGVYAGDERTVIGIRHRVELDNGFSGLFAYKDLSALPQPSEKRKMGD